MTDFLTIPLSNQHIKEHFDCGKEMLNRYLHQQARQDVKRHLAACFVLPNDDLVITGYYTLSSASIPRNLLSDEIIRKLPNSYYNLPVTLLGRLALDRSFFGKGFGTLLLIDALKRAHNASVGSVASMAIVVDPLDDEAIRFYLKFGFVLLPDSEKMFLPMTIVAKLFEPQQS